MCRSTGELGLFMASLLALVPAKSDAAVTSLGEVSSATTLGLGNTMLVSKFPQFTDSYLFTIDAGDTFDFSAYASTGFNKFYGIDDFEGALFDSGGLVANGTSTTRYNPFPSYDVSFPSIALSEGDYRLQLAGRPFLTDPLGFGSASYEGTLGFGEVTAPLPEPGALALTGLALAALGFSGLRRANRAR